MRRLWPAGVGLALAIALAVLVKPDSTMNRVVNLNLGDSKFRDTYLVLPRSEAERCFVVNRREATIRRSNDNQPGRKWRCHRISGSDAESPPAWLVQSKREGKGTVFFVPASRIGDWSFPFFYATARALHPDAQLPLVEWTQLYVRRLYQGLYLRVDLPFDQRKKDGGSGVLREILSISGDSASVVDTRFDDAPGLYAEAVAAGVFPKLEKPLPDIAWLAEHAPTAGTMFLVSNSEGSPVSLLPLPIGLPALFKARYGRSPATFTDKRFERWTQGAWRHEAGKAKQWVTRPGFQESFDDYTRDLRQALQVDALARGHSLKPGQWKRRQAAAESLDFVKGES